MCGEIVDLVKRDGVSFVTFVEKIELSIFSMWQYFLSCQTRLDVDTFF